MFWKTRVKGSALLSTVILSIIIFITCSLLMLALYYVKIFKARDDIRARLQDDSNAALSIALYQKSESSLNYKDSFLLYEDQPDSVYLAITQWGVFPTAGTSVVYKNRSLARQFLMGDQLHQYADANIYLADHDRPLSLAGDTYIEGKAYLPKSGLRSGFFAQTGYSRKKLIDGETDTSSKQLPLLSRSLLETCKTYETLMVDTLNLKATPIPDSLYNSFNNPVSHLRIARRQSLGFTKLTGKIIIVSDSTIDLDRHSQLSDVILIAPFIHITNGFRGSIQAFALDSISVGTGCNLQYPSALVGLGRNNRLGSTGATISIDSGSTVSGLIASFTSGSSTNIRPVVKIRNGAILDGMVYNTGYTYLNGTVYGAVFTDFFFEYRNGMSFENMLLDGRIYKSRYPFADLFFSIFKNSYKRDIVKWLQ